MIQHALEALPFPAGCDAGVFRSDRFVIARVGPTPGLTDQGTDAQVEIGVVICLPTAGLLEEPG